MPAISSLFTATVATYNIAHRDKAECIYFGSWVAMLSVDLGNQVLFIVGVVFINTMEIVFKKIEARRLYQRKDITELQIAKMKFQKNVFVAAFVACESAVLSLKGIIYLTDADWSQYQSLSAVPICFLVMHALRAIFSVTLLVKFVQQMRIYLREFKEHQSTSSRSKTLAVAIIVACLMTVSAVWYNFIIQYYYIVYLKMQKPSNDPYF